MTHGQVPDWYPWLAALYTDAEARFHGDAYVDWTRGRFDLAFALVGGYLLMCMVGWRLVPLLGGPFELRVALIAWNGALAVLSIAGMLRTVPHLVGLVHQKSLHFAICAEPGLSYGHGAVGLWTMVFIFSKVPELGDTIFLIARGRPIHVLQWYHHATVLLYVWHSYAYRSSVGLWFIALNYTVHSAMYTYFALVAARVRLHRAVAHAVTVAQIAQMVAGIALLACVAVYWYKGAECAQSRGNFAAGLVMYGSYLVLFAGLYADKYCRRAALKDD